MASMAEHMLPRFDGHLPPPPPPPPGVSFNLKTDVRRERMPPEEYIDFVRHVYRLNPVKQTQGKVVVITQPEACHLVAPFLKHGLVGTVFRAYNEHRSLILRPDDIWLAITTALSIYVNKHADDMRHHFVDFKDTKTLKVVADGTLYSVNWNKVLDTMSSLVQENTVSDTREWLEPDFTTTTPVCKTVGQIVMMGVLQKYFNYEVHLRCGLPKVTLEGTLEDWQKLRTKAAHLRTFKVECLTHWADLLDQILVKFIDSYQGHVDVDFWSRVCHEEDWGSGPRFLSGWMTVFLPFNETSGDYILWKALPEENTWAKIDMNRVPSSCVEVPVKIVDGDGTQHDTFFYGGHIVAAFDPMTDTLRPSIDWFIVDVTGQPPVPFIKYGRKGASGKEFDWNDLPKPVRFVYGA